MVNDEREARYQALAQKILARLTDYRRASETGAGAVLNQRPAPAISDALQLEHWVRRGGIDETQVDAFLDVYFANTQHMHHPHYIGHQVAVPHWSAGLAGLLHGVVNNPMAIYEMGPVSSVIERLMVNWLLEKVGWFAGAHLADFTVDDCGGAGVFTHGGSLANLTAVLAARAAAVPQAWQQGVPADLAVIVPATAHYSIPRAVAMAGFGAAAVQHAPVDEREVLKPEALAAVYQQVLAAGRRPMMVGVNACATSTGLYDPIDEVADFCEEHGLWLHVDGAHGASALLSDHEAGLLKGVQRADSLVWDAHKMMRTSTLCAAVLFREGYRLGDAFQQSGSYIFHEKEALGFDVMPYAVECTKSALAEKLFWVLATDGEAALTQYVERQYRVTREIYDAIRARDGFDCPYYPQSNILCFKYLPIKDNDGQLALRNQIVKRGRFYITTAEVNGVRYLRLSVMNALTEIQTIEALLDEIEQVATKL